MTIKERVLRRLGLICFFLVPKLIRLAQWFLKKALDLNTLADREFGRTRGKIWCEGVAAPLVFTGRQENGALIGGGFELGEDQHVEGFIALDWVRQQELAGVRPPEEDRFRDLWESLVKLNVDTRTYRKVQHNAGLDDDDVPMGFGLGDE